MTTCPRRMDELGPWEHQEGLDHWREGQACSFCGSAEPALVLEAIEAGVEIVPTDKNYKIYVHLPERRYAKFYFQHFSEEQKKQFVDLLNAKKIRLGAPGHFYVRPFFVEVRK